MGRGRLGGSRGGRGRGGRLAALTLVGLALWWSTAPVAAAGAESVVGVTVLDNTAEQIVLKYEIGAFREAPVMINGKAYQHLLLGTESLLKIAGAPELPRICRSVIIPDDAEMGLRIGEAQYYELNDIDIAPSKGILSRMVNPDDVPYTFGAAYGQDEFFPGPVATLRAPYILRDYRGVVVELNPFQYNPVTRTLRVYTEVTLELVAVGPGQVNVLERRPSELSLAFHQTYAHHFVNYQPAARYAPLDETGDMLIIAHDAWASNVMPLANHKNAIGINTTVVGVSTIGNNATAIKSHIQGVYNSSDLAFVLLVGDVDQVATPSASGGASDPSYAKLAGGDDYPDIMVGRFSASSSGHVDTQVERTIEYENMPATDQDWFWKGTGIASSEGAGIGDEGQSDIQHQNEIRGWLLGHGYTEVDQIYAPGATSAQVSAALNAGRGVLNYTGHGWWEGLSTTGFDVDAVNALTNDNMLPFMVVVACNPGEFDNYAECFGEACLRATHNGEPTGAIACYASSISQDWAPPMEAQDEFNLLLSDESEPYHSVGTLCFAGSCSMMDDYSGDGVAMFNTWILFGDPSLRVVGTVEPPTGLHVTPASSLNAAGPVGGPFAPDSIEYTLENLNETPINYTVSKTQPWVTLSTTGGTLPALGGTTVIVSINAAANGLGNGNYSDTVSFINTTDHDGDTTRDVDLQVGGPTVIYDFPLDSDPGWSTQGQWAFGAPTGQGGSHGNSDPGSGATGSNVYGVNLYGDYSTTPGGPYCLTTGALDLTDIEDVTLKFKRWLNTDYQPYVSATVEVSNNGSSWTMLWENGDDEIADSSWSDREFDISEVADGQATVYLRWGHEVGSYAWAYSGWNLDDVEIWGVSSGSEPINLVGSEPPDGAYDARQPLDPSTLQAQGWSTVALYFDGPTDALDPGKFALDEVCLAGNCDGVAPALQQVATNGLEAVLTFDRPIDPKAWTVIRYLEGAPDDVVRLGFLPADVDESGIVTANDVVQLVDYVTEAFSGGDPPPELADIDRSGVVTANDITVLVDLLNGAGPFDVYLNASLPEMP